MIPRIIRIEEKHYYNADDLKKYDPTYFKGCPNPRKILERVNIPENQYIFASLANGLWKIKDNKYKKAIFFVRKNM
jgi:hypothetical protein